MEKFAVDLDKVLDDFEFNEEQAVRNSSYLHEELPAKKYQRPSFQRINLADADFSPSKQTTTPHPFNFDHDASKSFPQPLLITNSIAPSLKTIEYQNDNDEEAYQALLNDTSDESDSDFKNVTPNSVHEPRPVPDLLGTDIISNSSIHLPDLTETGVDNVHEPDVIGSNAISFQPPAVELMLENQESHGSHAGSEQAHCVEDRAYNGNQLGNNGLPSVDYDSDIVDSICVLADEAHGCSMLNEKTTEEDVGAAAISDNLQNNNEISEMSTVMETDNDVSRQEDIAACLEITAGVLSENEEVKEIATDEAVVEPIQYVGETEISEEDLEIYLEKLEAEQNESDLQQDVQIKQVEETSVVEEKLNNVDATEELSRDVPQRPTSLDLNGVQVNQTANDAAVVKPIENPTENSDDNVNSIDENSCASSEVVELKEDQDRDETSAESEIGLESPVALTTEERNLGKVSPFWVPDEDALNCMQCGLKFTVIKRRHHCRACGRVLCGKCCGMRATIEYLRNQEHRVCELCFRTLTKVMMYEETDSEVEFSPTRRPNPNNPMEYCSTVPPPLQASPSSSQSTISVLVPVLKREGAVKVRDPQRKVIFSDGIRPGGDLTDLDEPPPPRVQKLPASAKRVGTPPGSVAPSPVRMLPPIDPSSQSFILEQCLPPLCAPPNAGVITYLDALPQEEMMERLASPTQPPLLFALNRHLIVSLKIVTKDCCLGHVCWAFVTMGMAAVGQDEIVILLKRIDEDEPVPVEIFMQLHYIYQSADKGNSIDELGYWAVKQSTFLDSRQHGGFLFVRPTFQCVRNIQNPRPPYLVGVLIHRLELPWARQFPLRLMLRLGAEFRYYPCNLVSVRRREPVYYEIGQTFMKLLADFRNYTYTLPPVRGLKIHMESEQTSVLIPKNRYDQIVRALNNSNDPVLAFAGSFSSDADAHLVCMQSDEVTYSTHAINIHDKPRKVTGASFIVFSASLKTAGGTQGKSRMIEDGLMVEISSDTMAGLRGKLRACESWSVRCGANSEELIQVVWCPDDQDFNKGVVSGIDKKSLAGVPSIRVHNGADYICGLRCIRWTEVFIIKCEDGVTSAKIGDPLEVKRLSENIARATCTALTKGDLLEHLATSGISCLSLRATIAPEVVCFEVGSNGEKLPPISMNSLDNELIPVLHKASASTSDATAILELIFYILEQ